MKPFSFMKPLLLLQLFLLLVASVRSQSSAVRRLQLRILQNRLRSLTADLPLESGIVALSEICAGILDLGIIQPRIVPDMSRMNFVLQVDACRNVSIPLNRAEDLWTATGFSQDKPTVIFITGWGSTINRSNSGPVAKAFACRNDTNFVILDAANFIRTLYTWSALNTEVIGEYVAEALLKLNRSYVTQHVHVIGHSLGAQIAGSTGRNFMELSGGDTLRRVTGLDPANPCFYDGDMLPGVASGDARYVDIIHTNPGVAGVSDSVGDGDFYVQGLSPFITGCGIRGANGCAHQRAVDYLTESVYPNNTRNFRGKRCDTFEDVASGRKCARRNPAIMGYEASQPGLFYVEVNSEEPYGKDANPNTFTPSNSTCGACAADS